MRHLMVSLSKTSPALAKTGVEKVIKSTIGWINHFRTSRGGTTASPGPPLPSVHSRLHFWDFDNHKATKCLSRDVKDGGQVLDNLPASSAKEINVKTNFSGCLSLTIVRRVIVNGKLH